MDKKYYSASKAKNSPNYGNCTLIPLVPPRFHDIYLHIPDYTLFNGTYPSHQYLKSHTKAPLRHVKPEVSEMDIKF